jgi:hypothetical protein
MVSCVRVRAACVLVLPTGIGCTKVGLHPRVDLARDRRRDEYLGRELEPPALEGSCSRSPALDS